MVNNDEVVLVQVSGGREEMLKPGLNIIGGIQPRGPRESIPGIPGIPEEVGAEWSIDMVDDGRTAAELICVSMSMLCISCRLTISMPGMLDIAGISDLVVDCSGATVGSVGSMPSPVAASRTLWGRQSTLPMPLAKTVSTQDGKAPVSKYRANTTSESSCVQSFRRIFVASRSASNRVAT